jgi:hypothetical protein
MSLALLSKKPPQLDIFVIPCLSYLILSFPHLPFPNLTYPTGSICDEERGRGVFCTKKGAPVFSERSPDSRGGCRGLHTKTYITRGWGDDEFPHPRSSWRRSIGGSDWESKGHLT